MDARLGRFLTIDAAWKNLTSLSPFHFAGNNPIIFIDSDGNLLRFPDTQVGEISKEQLLFIDIYQSSTDEYRAELDKLISSDVIYDIAFVSKEVIEGRGGLTSLSEELNECGEEQLVIKIQINVDMNESRQVWAMGDELQSALNFENNKTGFTQTIGSEKFTTLSNNLKDEWLSQLAGCEAFNQLSNKYPDKIKEQDLFEEQQSLSLMYNNDNSGEAKNNLFDNNARALAWFLTGRARQYYNSIGGNIGEYDDADYGCSDEKWSKIMVSEGLSRVVFKRSSEENITDIKQ